MLSAMMLLLVLTPTTPAPAPAPEAAAGPGVIRVVVSDLARSNDVSERLGRIVADNLVAELRKLVGVSVVSMAANTCASSAGRCAPSISSEQR